MKHAFVRFTSGCLLLLWIAVGAAAQEQQPNSMPTVATIAGATVAEWKGDVRLSLPGQLPANPLRGEQLPAGTILDTGAGRLLLRLSDGSEVLVRSHTTLQLQQPSLLDPSYFQLLLGRIRALINKRTGGTIPFELGTPSAVIAVRGTQFDVEVNRQNVTEVDVIDGLVQVYGRNAAAGSVFVEPGFSTRVGLDLAPEQPVPTNEMRPEVERPEPGKNGEAGKSEGEVEFGRAEDRDDGEVENAHGDIDGGDVYDGESAGQQGDSETDQTGQDNSPPDLSLSLRTSGLSSASYPLFHLQKSWLVRPNALLRY
jgi:hypothetical protein